MNKMINYLPSIIWLAFVASYTQINVGLNNLFALLPHETILFIATAIVPVIANHVFLGILTNWLNPKEKVKLVVDTEPTEEVGSAEASAWARDILNPSAKPGKDIPVEGLIEGFRSLLANNK